MAKALAASSTEMTWLTSAARGQAHDRALEPVAVPAVAEAGADAGHLRADELDAVVVELLAQGEPGALALEEPGRHHPGVVGGGADGLVQGPVGPGDLDRHVGAAPVG